ncbi:MAG: pyridoxal phosphate-dependent aminotransferase [Gammaproteobacteria bacterium]|nr:pyridoxal phosphate-dependent aminotransferase [Gammaproteobacteria bacterium]
MRDIQPFHVMALLARARELEAQGRSIIHMEIGEPDFVTPDPILEAGKQAFNDGHTHYTPALGLPQLREAIAYYYEQHYQLTIASQRIVITPGASGALLLVLGVLINPGEQVLMADPGYPCNRNFVRFMDGDAVGIPVDASTDYQLSKELIEQHWTDKTRAVILASPSNPTGTLVDKKSLQEINEFIQQKNACLIVDEIYHGLIYEDKPESALALSNNKSNNKPNNIFVINSFSKYFNMTGWRLGWLVAPPAIIDDLDKLAQNIFLAAPTPAQYAALAAFKEETITILDQRCQEFKQRRDFLLPALRDIGFNISSTPQGAFYLYAECSQFTNDSYQFAIKLLEEKGVAITPGIDFGKNKANTHVRFAYTTSMVNLREGVERLKSFVS